MGQWHVHAPCKRCIGKAGSILPDLLTFTEKLKMCVCVGGGAV